MKLTALKRLHYPSGPSGKEYAAGDHFEALTERDAKALTLVGKAKARDPDPEPVYTPKVMQAEKVSAPETPVAAPTKPKKRAYKRRDMKAED